MAPIVGTPAATTTPPLTPDLAPTPAPSHPAALPSPDQPTPSNRPSLATALTIIGNRDVWIEVKSLPRAYDDALLAALDGGPFPARYAVHSFDHRITARLAAVRPDLALGALLSARVVDPVSVLRNAKATTLWQEWTMIDQDLVNVVHAAHARVIAWTVNDQAAAGRLSRMGVDGLCGNFPDRLAVAA